jgi:hypothetical protein
MELIIKPAFAHLDLSLDRTKRATPNITGVPNTIRSPPRPPKREPQPKPGILSNCGMAKTQGDRASQKLNFPNSNDFIVQYSFGTISRGYGDWKLIFPLAGSRKFTTFSTKQQ